MPSSVTQSTQAINEGEAIIEDLVAALRLNDSDKVEHLLQLATKLKSNKSPSQPNSQKVTKQSSRKQVQDYIARKPVKLVPGEFDLSKICNSKEERVVDLDWQRLIARERWIQEYDQIKGLKVLCHKDYEVVTERGQAICIGKGTCGELILARELSTNKLVTIKVVSEGLEDLLFEFTLQAKAHDLLGKYSAKFIGFLQKKDRGKNGEIAYMPVMEFYPVTGDAKVSLTFDEALMQHCEGNRMITGDEWIAICMTLLESARTLNAHNIYHIDLSDYNVLLTFDERNQVSPIIIDYGMSRNGARGMKSHQVGHKSIFLPNPCAAIMFPHSAPELFEQNYPTPTTDLFTVVYCMSRVSRFVFGCVMFQERVGYAYEVPPHERPLYHDLKRRIIAQFEKLATRIRR